MVFEELSTKPVDDESGQQIAVDQNEAGTKLIVYYFHTDFRCATCKKFEEYTQEALNTYFTDEIKEKQIVWQPVNYDRDENKHFVGKYHLVSKSVVLSKVTDGKEANWKNLDQIWEKVGDKEQYMEYVRSGVEEFYKGQKL
jgi:hypothetical protein